MKTLDYGDHVGSHWLVEKGVEALHLHLMLGALSRIYSLM